MIRYAKHENVFIYVLYNIHFNLTHTSLFHILIQKVPEISFLCWKCHNPINNMYSNSFCNCTYYCYFLNSHFNKLTLYAY